jgi:hypothetical protein
MNDLVEVPTPIADSKFVAMLCNFQSITSFLADSKLKVSQLNLSFHFDELYIFRRSSILGWETFCRLIGGTQVLHERCLRDSDVLSNADNPDFAASDERIGRIVSDFQGFSEVINGEYNWKGFHRNVCSIHSFITPFVIVQKYLSINNMGEKIFEEF